MSIEVRVKDTVVRSNDPDASVEHARGLAEVMAENQLEGTTDADTICIEVDGVKYYSTTEYVS